MNKITRPIQDILKIKDDHLTAYGVGLLQGKAYRVLYRYLSDTLSWYDLTVNEWKLIGQLYDHGPMDQKELMKRLSIDLTIFKKSIERLKKKKYLKSSVKDTYEITTKAEEMIPLLETAVKEKMALLTEGISRIEMLIYIKVLQKIVDNAAIENE